VHLVGELTVLRYVDVDMGRIFEFMCDRFVTECQALVKNEAKCRSSKRVQLVASRLSALCNAHSLLTTEQIYRGFCLRVKVNTA
jgi:hypothetical protein